MVIGPVRIVLPFADHTGAARMMNTEVLSERFGGFGHVAPLSLPSEDSER